MLSPRLDPKIIKTTTLIKSNNYVLDDAIFASGHDIELFCGNLFCGYLAPSTPTVLKISRVPVATVSFAHNTDDDWYKKTIDCQQAAFVSADTGSEIMRILIPRLGHDDL
jgi:hypothetical protein